MILKKGTIVDSTIIAAPSSTKNRAKKRDWDAHSVKKGNTWHLGYKAHIDVDQDTGLIHHVEVTSANIHDVTGEIFYPGQGGAYFRRGQRSL